MEIYWNIFYNLKLKIFFTFSHFRKISYFLPNSRYPPLALALRAATALWKECKRVKTYKSSPMTSENNEKWSMFPLNKNPVFGISQMTDIWAEIEQKLLYKIAYFAFRGDLIYENGKRLKIEQISIFLMYFSAYLIIMWTDRNQIIRLKYNVVDQDLVLFVRIIRSVINYLRKR